MIFENSVEKTMFNKQNCTHVKIQFVSLEIKTLRFVFLFVICFFAILDFLNGYHYINTNR